MFPCNFLLKRGEKKGDNHLPLCFLTLKFQRKERFLTARGEYFVEQRNNETTQQRNNATTQQRNNKMNFQILTKPCEGAANRERTRVCLLVLCSSQQHGGDEEDPPFP
jgi:hypothetical protein